MLTVQFRVPAGHGALVHTSALQVSNLAPVYKRWGGGTTFRGKFERSCRTKVRANFHAILGDAKVRANIIDL